MYPKARNKIIETRWPCHIRRTIKTAFDTDVRQFNNLFAVLDAMFDKIPYIFCRPFPLSV